MSRGGSRNRSGPPPDPNSERSEQRGYTLAALPSDGYSGEVPEFPLEDPTVRELDVWAWAWSQPQGCAWSMPSERWRIRSVAMWVRVSVQCESPEASASLLSQLHRFADQVGLTTAGLAEMGWRIADEPPTQSARSGGDDTPSPGRRLRSVV